MSGANCWQRTRLAVVEKLRAGPEVRNSTDASLSWSSSRFTMLEGEWDVPGEASPFGPKSPPEKPLSLRRFDVGVVTMLPCPPCPSELRPLSLTEGASSQP